MSGHAYAMLLRPPSSVTLPRGLRWTLAERGRLLDVAPLRTDLPRGDAPYGVIVADRPLSRDECDAYSLRYEGTRAASPEAAR